ncbi:MAG TPA: PaaI family thioesterase, partial [Pyrinomonadaceae bacterium]|nr:PaaI family thioesterase [Pyrinomonadaceae bacterium]
IANRVSRNLVGRIPEKIAMSDENITSFTEEQKMRAKAALETLGIGRLLDMKMVDLRPREATLELEIRDELRQPSGVLHGGVTATLIDTAMAFAIIPLLNPGESTATVDLTIHYLRPHANGKAVCTARIVRAGRRFFTVSADVISENEKLIATAISTYAKV